MNKEEFIREYEIAYFVEGDLNMNEFITIKSEIPIESDDLYVQLVKNKTPQGLNEYLQGSILPRIWGQGNVTGLICKPNEEKIIILVYQDKFSGVDSIVFTSTLNEQIEKMY